ncbi:hypothetical protein BH23BAC4_BH23BAC4_05850 [soil metagenome]
MNPRLKTALWISGPVAVLALILVPRLFFSGDGPTAGPAAGPPEAPLVTAVAVRLTQIEDAVRSTGTLLPDEEVEIRSEVGGRVTTIRFNEGSYVRAGQLLASIDTRVLEAELAAATSRRDLARVQVERQQSLFDIGGLSRQALDQTITESRVLESDIERLRAEIERRRIYAPFSGQIGLRGLSAGAVVGAGERIATLRRLDPIKLEFQVPERYLGSVRNGDLVHFTVPGMDSDLTATVYAIEPAVRQET